MPEERFFVYYTVAVFCSVQTLFAAKYAELGVLKILEKMDIDQPDPRQLAELKSRCSEYTVSRRKYQFVTSLAIVYSLWLSGVIGN